MNKKPVQFSLLLLSLTTSALVVASLWSNSTSFTSGVDNSIWVHYLKKEATSTSNGIREYWVSCSGGGYRFTKPDSSKIVEATSYNTSQFTTNDPRYIKYVSDDVQVYYIPSSETFDFAEATYLQGYSAFNVSSEIGNLSRLEFIKDDNSPIYTANCLTVSGTIGSNDDLTSLQLKILNGNESGYYVFTNDLTSPTSQITKIGDNIGTFSGILDGRNHTVTSPSFWNKRMLGKTDGATIKNLNFKNISIFSVLAVSMYDTTVDNVNFYLSNSINSWSNVGMICDGIYGSTNFKNMVIDYGSNEHVYPAGSHLTGIVAATNYTNYDNKTFDNVTIKCLASAPLFISDYYGRSLSANNQTGVNYVAQQYFIQNGTLNYDIKYPSDDADAKDAATKIKSAIYQATGKSMTLNAYSDTAFSKDTTSIILGDDAAINEYYFNVPVDEGAYSIHTFGKAIYINASDDVGYQEATLKFLEKSIGYDYYGDGINSNTIQDKNNVDIFCINIEGQSAFSCKRADWGDAYNTDMYLYGYNVTGYTSDDIYIDVPGHSDDPHLKNSEKFHTMLRILYPGDYINDHWKWYATDLFNSLPSKTDDSYYAYQLCFTAHGNSDEYNAMVEEATNNIIEVFANNTNLNLDTICFGIGDSYNYCKCYTCRNKTSSYGSIAGTLVNFVNDVATAVNQRVSETNRDVIHFQTFAYTSYREAPIVDDSPSITCANNVSILLAPIEANYTYSLGDSTHNSEAYQTIEEWSKVGSLSCWLYDTNFSNYLYPYNSFESMTETISYFKDKNVDVMYVEGQHNLRPQRRTGFNQLKKYLNAKFMNSTDSDYETLVDRFFKNYYGANGSSYLRTFFDEMVARLKTFETDSTLNNILTSGGTARSIYSNISDSRLWDKDQLVKWMNLCSTAYSLENNAKIKEHILAESIFPRFNLCSNFASSFSDNEILAMRQSFKTDADSLNVTYVMESGTLISSYYQAWGIS